MGRQQEFIFAKNLQWPMSNYNFNIGYNLTFVYFGRQLVAVKIKQGIFLAVSQDHNNWSRGKTLQLIFFTETEPRQT